MDYYKLIILKYFSEIKCHNDMVNAYNKVFCDVRVNKGKENMLSRKCKQYMISFHLKWVLVSQSKIVE